MGEACAPSSMFCLFVGFVELHSTGVNTAPFICTKFPGTLTRDVSPECCSRDTAGSAWACVSYGDSIGPLIRSYTLVIQVFSQTINELACQRA